MIVDISLFCQSVISLFNRLMHILLFLFGLGLYVICSNSMWKTAYTYHFQVYAKEI